MGNTVLTPTAVTRKALAILHQKLNFVGNVNRTYDSSFAKTGAKIGDSLKIRLPNEFTIRSGASLSTQDVTETSTTLQVATQKGVDTTFSSSELTLSLDDFASRILEPAMSVLAANIEADALAMYKDVYNVYDQDATAFALSSMLGGRKILNDNLAPMDSNRTALLTTDAAVKFMTDTKGLFQDSAQIAKQYRDGVIGKTAGFDVYENTLLVPHTTGTSPKTTTYTVNGAITTNGTAAVTVATGTATFAIGDVFTVAGCFRVHPETKVSTGVLQQFVVAADYAGGAGSLTFTPAIYTTTGRQNVTAGGMPNSGAIVKVAAGASELVNGSLAFYRDAFTFVTADLPMPKGTDMAASSTYDGVTVSLVRDFDIATRDFKTRLDILYGFAAIRPQLACRIHADA
jgi:hypothetical protein